MGKHVRPQGKGSKKKKNQKNNNRKIAELQAKRERDLNLLSATDHKGRHLSPAVSIKERGKYSEEMQEESEATKAFYDEQKGRANAWLMVSERPNVSNPDGVSGGGKGVFAKKSIPSDTLVAPYVGILQASACDAKIGCQYCLKVCKGQVICSRETKVDMMYSLKFQVKDLRSAIHDPQ